MKSSLLLCLFTLLLLALILAACQTESPEPGSGSSYMPSNTSSSAPITTTGVTVAPTPQLTTSLIPTTSEIVPDESGANSSSLPGTSSAPIPETTAPITVPPVTTDEEPIVTTAPVAPPPVTTTVTTVTTTTVPVTSAPLAPESEWIVVCESFLNLRKTASTASAILTKIPAGDSVEVLGFTGYFAKINYYNYSGYVHASYLVRREGMGSEVDLTVVKPEQNYSHQQMLNDLQTLADKFPDLLKLSSIGTSEQGRDLTLCLLGNPEAERNILMQASIHGREHVVTQVAVGEIDYILHHQDMVLDNGMTVAELLDKVCFHIVPMSNPDGVTISQTGVMPPPFSDQYSKNTAPVWKANANGVDLNANFDAFWDKYGSIYDSYTPSYAGYRGTAPECAAESKALAGYLRSADFDLTLSYHTSGSLIYWSFDYDNCPEVNRKSYEVGQLLSKKNGYLLGEQRTNSTAGFKDYAMQALGIPSLTIEFAIGSAPVKFSEFEQIWERGKLTLLTCAQWTLTQE